MLIINYFLTHFHFSDVKPDNYLLSKADPGKVLIIDFGLAQQLNKKIEVKGDGFVGTKEYASLGAHASENPAKIQDIESLCYCIENLTSGKLVLLQQPRDRMRMEKVNWHNDNENAFKGVSFNYND